MTIGSPVVIPTPTTSIPTVNEVFVPVDANVWSPSAYPAGWTKV